MTGVVLDGADWFNTIAFICKEVRAVLNDALVEEEEVSKGNAVLHNDFVAVIASFNSVILGIVLCRAVGGFCCN